MSDTEPHETGIDSLLRRSMGARVPSLPPNFDQRLMSELRQSSQGLGRYGRILLTVYGLISVVVSAVVMRGQGLGWGAIAAMILGPLGLVATVPWARRPTLPPCGPVPGRPGEQDSTSAMGLVTNASATLGLSA